MPEGEIVLYRTEDGHMQMQLRASEGTVWLTQAEMAELFETSKPNVNMHLKHIFEEGELRQKSVIQQNLTTATDGKSYKTTFYNLEAILAVGFRVRSPRGVQFRHWATTTLREYLLKGFVLNDERLKDPGGFDYFDELLQRIRDIRTSEKRFYQKVRDVYATATDYDAQSDAAQTFFATVQNKMLYAVTGKTAAELIYERADATKSNMGLTSWKGERVRKGDAEIAKNYLNAEEIEELNRIVVMYLNFAEDQAKHRQSMTMQKWAERLDAFLHFNERAVLTHNGTISADMAKQVALERYETFDEVRRKDEALSAEAEHAQEIHDLTEFLKALPPREKSELKDGTVH